MSVNKTPRGLEKGVKGVGSKDQRNVCLEKRGDRRRGEERMRWKWNDIKMGKTIMS